VDIQIPLASLLPPRPEIRGLTQLIAQLKPGQQISAVVESHISENYYLLRLPENGLQLRARTAQALQAGQVLDLRVEQAGDTPTLKILAQNTPPPPAEAAIQQATRDFLPKQLPLRSLVEALSQPQKPTAASEPGPASVSVSAQRELSRAMPKREQLTTEDGLKQAVKRAGLFLEARLAAAAPHQFGEVARTDLKSRLMVLVEALHKEIRSVEGETRPPQSHPEPPRAMPDAYPPRPATSAAPHSQPQSSGQAETAPGSQAPPTAEPSSSASPAAPAPQPSESTEAVPGQPPAASGKTAETATSATEPEQSKQAQPPIATDEGTIILEQAAPPSDTEASVDHTPASQPQTTADAAESAPPATEAKPQPHAGPAETAPGARPAAPSASPGVVSAQDFELAGLRSMLEKAEGALATVVLDQLASLPLADDRQSVWQIDIPYTNDQGADVARLKVVREGKRGAAAAQSFWSVTLQLKPPGLGTLNARITLIGGSIDSYFWSDRPATTDMVASHLDVLAARLQHAGLDIGRLDTLPAAPSDAADTAPGQAFSILDEKA
jgi:hypothetical protein